MKPTHTFHIKVFAGVFLLGALFAQVAFAQDGGAIPPSDPAPEMSAGSVEVPVSDPVTNSKAEPVSSTPAPTPTSTPQAGTGAGASPALPQEIISETEPAAAQPLPAEATSEEDLDFSYLMLALAGFFVLALGAFAFSQSGKAKPKGTSCEAIKTLADQKKTALQASRAQFSLQETIIEKLKEKIADSAKSKAAQATGLEGTVAHRVYETYEVLKGKLEKAEKILDAVKALQQKLTGEIDSLELQYKTCVAGLAVPGLASGFTLPLGGQKYAFVDRDGTFLYEPEKPSGVNAHETFPLKSMSEFRFMDGAVEGLKALADKGYQLVMVTNQTFLGTPKHPKEMFDAVMKKIEDELGKQEIRFEYVMVCPHGPDEGCDCRKPKTGGLKDFFEKRKGNIDLKNSLMFGDRDTDRQFAENLGVRFLKIETNKRFELPRDI